LCSKKKNQVKKSIIILICMFLLTVGIYYIVSYNNAIEYTKTETETTEPSTEKIVDDTIEEDVVEQVQTNKYVNIEYPEDVFMYTYNNVDNKMFEVDQTYEIEHELWEIIMSEDDLYVNKKQSKEAKAYYQDVNNYDWYIVFDDEEYQLHPIIIDEKELTVIDNFTDMEKNMSVFFDEMKEFGSLVKISKDKLIYGTTTIVKHEDTWYYKSDIIDDEIEEDGTNPTYVKMLPLSLNDKIKKLEGKENGSK